MSLLALSHLTKFTYKEVNAISICLKAIVTHNSEIPPVINDVHSLQFSMKWFLSITYGVYVVRLPSMTLA